MKTSQREGTRLRVLSVRTIRPPVRPGVRSA